MLAMHNHVMDINWNHQINVNAIEEYIDIETRPRAAIQNDEANIDFDQPYIANPLRRSNYHWTREFIRKNNQKFQVDLDLK